MSTDVTIGDLHEVLKALESRRQGFEIGYVSTPHAVSWVRRQGHELVGATGPIELDWVYEARLFGADGDLRWTWHQDHGRWTVIDDALAKARGWSVLGEQDHQRVRLLRGEARADGSNGWTSLWDKQAAPFAVPLEVAQGKRVAITAIEYVQQNSEHGTVDVVTERFVALHAWKGTKE